VLAFGYTRARIADGSILLRPVLPPHATELVLQGVRYMGNTLDIQVQASSASTSGVSVQFNLTSTASSIHWSSVYGTSNSQLSSGFADALGRSAQARAACGQHDGSSDTEIYCDILSASESDKSGGNFVPLCVRNALSTQWTPLRIGYPVSLDAPPASGNASSIELGSCPSMA